MPAATRLATKIVRIVISPSTTNVYEPLLCSITLAPNTFSLSARFRESSTALKYFIGTRPSLT